MNAPTASHNFTPVTVYSVSGAYGAIIIPASIPSGYARQAQLLADATQNVAV